MGQKPFEIDLAKKFIWIFLEKTDSVKTVYFYLYVP